MPRNNGRAARATARKRIAKEIDEQTTIFPQDAVAKLAEVKRNSRKELAMLLDHLDALAERDRLVVLVTLHQFLQQVLIEFCEHVREKHHPEPLSRTPRVAAFEAGKTEGVFRDSFFA